MAQDASGIMSLQEDYFSKGMLPPEMGLEVADGTMQNLNPALRPAVDGLTSEISGQLADISDEELDQVIQLVQQLYDDPDNYAQNRAALIQSGELTDEDLPPEYDPEALAMMLYTLRKEKQARSSGAPSGTMPPMAGAAPADMQPPQGFARGGIAEAARLVAGSGRYGDTMLAHINPQEARLLMKHGGSGTINPKTGLPEFIFKFLRKVWQAVWKPVKKFLNTKIGKIVANVALNVLIPGFGSVIAAGLTTAASGGNFGDIVKNMAIAGATSYLSGGLADKGFPSPIQGPLNAVADLAGITTQAGRMALNQGLVTTGMGLVQGQNLKDAATSGLTAAATVQAANYAGKLLSPQGGPTGEGNRFLTDDRNAMQKAYGDKVGLGKAPIDERGLPAVTHESSYTSGNPGATISPSASVSPSVSATSSTGSVGVNPTGSTLYKPVEIGDALSTMGTGARQILTGDFSKGFETLGKGSSDLFMPSGPTDTQVLDLKKAYMTQDPTLSSAEALKMAQNQAPGVVRTYGPGVAAGIGALALGGGFSPQQDPNAGAGPQMRGPSGEDLIKADPNKYLVQGMPGVQYDAQGNIIGGNPAAYQYKNMQDVRVATPNYFQSRPSQFAVGGIANIDNPRNNLTLANSPAGMTAAEFKKQEEDKKKKAGIAALATGGYPRKTGQISGPGTETSDSIPAMLSDGEFVMTARAVRGLGKGSRREGAKKMYALMHQLERNAARG